MFSFQRVQNNERGGLCTLEDLSQKEKSKKVMRKSCLHTKGENSHTHNIYIYACNNTYIDSLSLSLSYVFYVCVCDMCIACMYIALYA